LPLLLSALSPQASFRIQQMHQRVDAVDDAVARIDPGSRQRALVIAARGGFDGGGERTLGSTQPGIETFSSAVNSGSK